MKMFKNPPECENQSLCRFEGGQTFTATLAYTPTVYDRHGNLLNPPWGADKGITTHWRCLSCGKSWTESS